MPTKEQAYAFAVMLQAGLPPSDAILYFATSEDTAELTIMVRKWMRAAEVRRAVAGLMGKNWTDMSLEEKRDYALNHHYTQMAYFLYSNHYAELGGPDKAKADTARQALEAHKAGTAGKTDALSRFFDDIKSGTVKLGQPITKVN